MDIEVERIRFASKSPPKSSQIYMALKIQVIFNPQWVLSPLEYEDYKHIWPTDYERGVNTDRFTLTHAGVHTHTHS